VGFFFANFFFGVPLFLASVFLTVFFIGFPFFPANPFGFVRFLFSFVLGHTRSLPPAHACPRNRARCIARKPTVPQFPQCLPTYRNACRNLQERPMPTLTDTILTSGAAMVLTLLVPSTLLGWGSEGHEIAALAQSPSDFESTSGTARRSVISRTRVENGVGLRCLR
jgi:hypothetical protein